MISHCNAIISVVNFHTFPTNKKNNTKGQLGTSLFGMAFLAQNLCPAATESIFGEEVDGLRDGDLSGGMRELATEIQVAGERYRLARLRTGEAIVARLALVVPRGGIAGSEAEQEEMLALREYSKLLRAYSQLPAKESGGCGTADSGGWQLQEQKRKKERLEELGVHDEADQDIGDMLRLGLDNARREYFSAKKKFDDILAEVRSGLPSPDGWLRLQYAGKESEQTYANFSRALQRFSQFILYRLYPEDLEP